MSEKHKFGKFEIGISCHYENNMNQLFIFQSLQLCVNVQIPKNLRGLGGGAIFIDTNRGFSLDRIKG